MEFNHRRNLNRNSLHSLIAVVPLWQVVAILRQTCTIFMSSGQLVRAPVTIR